MAAGAALTLMAVQFSSRQIHENLTDGVRAELLVHSGISWSQAFVVRTPNWRTKNVKKLTNTVNLGALGSITVDLSDPGNDLADNDAEPVAVNVVSNVDGLNRTFQYTAGPGSSSALEYGIASEGEVSFDGYATVTRPVYGKKGIYDRGGGHVTVSADGRFDVPTGQGVTTGLNPKNLSYCCMDPISYDSSYYASIATTIAPTSSAATSVELRNVLLSSTRCTNGAVNANGVYIIDIGAKSLRMRDVCVRGTLLIKGNSGVNVLIEDGARFESGALQFPSLIIDIKNNTVQLAMDSSLSESSAGVDFSEDGDTADLLPSGVIGVAWIKAGSVYLEGSSWTLNGTLVAKGDVHVDDAVVIGGDRSWGQFVLPGLTDGQLHLNPGTFQEVLP